MKTADARAYPLRESRSGRLGAPVGDWGPRSGRSGRKVSNFEGALSGRRNGAVQGAIYVEARTI